ncbi:hypothetical protein [uncultured Roseobacter sp.]|uniref:hypothetical protein n=1 Tax=uncultured Roseobacter sp. TaxID=114847 RepID=UPI00263954A5|nr:hypothetical protein [uncultured Roseobacter sp.]
MPILPGRAAADLVQVPLLLPQTDADIWVVGHPDIWPSRKLSAFRDILTPYCKAHRDSFVACRS